MSSSEIDDQWTTEFFIEELFQTLASTKTVAQKKGREITVSPYKQQVNQLMYRIPIYKPSPPFVINWRDLTPKLQDEILRLQNDCKPQIFEQIIIDCIGKLFEIENPRYYHGSVRQYLKVKFIQ